MSESSEATGGGEAGAAETTRPRRVNGTPVALRPRRQPRHFSRWRWLWVLLPVALIYPIYLAGCALLGVRTVDVEATPLPLGATGVPDEAWAEVLDDYLAAGRVDYSSLAANSAGLERYAATLAEVGPESTPARFPTPADALAYYLNAYNALTMVGVVEHWPIDSVQDVHGPFEPNPGFGFFWGLRFALDGDTTSLYDLENDVLRELGDARIHGAINCASAGCPALAPQPYRAETLDAQLDAAARHLASEPPHVVVDDEAHEIRLSAIYDWYAEDFEAHAAALGVGSTVLDWVAHYAAPDVAEALAHGREAGYRVVYVPYDWSLNGG